MTLRMRNIGGLALFALFTTFAAGCATTDRKVTVLYQPSVYAHGGSGNLYLTAAGVHSASGKTGNTQLVIGKVKDTDGNQTGDIVTTVTPADLILDAFSRELSNAGYKVIRTNTLPGDVPKGISVATTEIKMEDVSSLIKDEGSGRLTVSLELWKNGKKFKKFYYESGYSDSAFKGRDLLLQDILQKALQGLMEKAVPEIIREMEK